MRTLSPLIVLPLLLGAAFVMSLAVGASGLPPGVVLDVLTGGGDATAQAIVLQLRLPRALMAVLVGGALGVSGSVFQALLRNPLAEPYVLGVSGGAAVGAVGAVVLGWSVAAPWALPLAAFVGALVAIGLVLRIALAVGPTLNARVFILAGVVVGAFFNAVILLLLSLSDAEALRSALYWMMGNVGGAGWRSVGILALYLGPTLVFLLALARPLDLLALGDETAAFLGVRAERVKWGAYLATSLAVAASVAMTGIIGFVGLIVPHAIRMVWGSAHRMLLPASFLGGAAFLLAADTVARTVASPAELPTGVVTALAGVPLFVLLLIRSGR
jgi:iron complex transport system permease protein